MPKALLTLLLLLVLPAYATKLPPETLQSIQKNSEQKCLRELKQQGKKGTRCGMWAQCYTSEIGRTTTLEEMVQANTLLKAGKKPGKDFLKKMMQASSACVSRANKQKP